MDKFNIPLVAEGLITYAVERQTGRERVQLIGDPLWAERRQSWAEAVLQGMAELEGLAPDAKFLERYDNALEQAKQGISIEPAPPRLQKEVGQNFMRYVSALKNAEGDNRHQLAEAKELARDIATHYPWASHNIQLFESVICTAGDMLERMTAERPIRFTHIDRKSVV